MRNSLPFACDRTCPLAGERFCRFRPVLDLLGPVAVNSQTATIRVEFRDPGTLKSAVLAMGGTWLGQGTHHLYGGNQVGHGFQLSGWRYPIVLQDGQLAYDDYHGQWGNVQDLEKLKAEYTVALAEQAAQAQGWQCQRTAEGLTIFYPQGGSITVTAGGNVEAHGFQGAGCHDAILALNLPVQDLQAKPEFAATAARVQLPMM